MDPGQSGQETRLHGHSHGKGDRHLGGTLLSQPSKTFAFTGLLLEGYDQKEETATKTAATRTTTNTAACINCRSARRNDDPNVGNNAYGRHWLVFISIYLQYI